MKFRMRVRSALGAPLALGLTMMIGTAQLAQAQTPPAQQPPTQGQPPAAGQPPAGQAAPAAPAAKEEPTFTAPAGLLLVQIKPDKTQAYETMLTKLKEALAKSEKPERRAMAKGWKVYKASEPAPGGVIIYVHVVEQTAPGDYSNPLLIINEVFPSEAQGIYASVKDGFVQTSRLNLTLVQDLSSAAGSAGAASAAGPASANPAPPKQ